MIRILLDECLPKKLKYRIEELDKAFKVETAPELGWASFTNGELFSVAEKEFDLFITAILTKLTVIPNEEIRQMAENGFEGSPSDGYDSMKDFGQICAIPTGLLASALQDANREVLEK